MKVYVIGDYGLDKYHIGSVRGLSAEVPIPVVNIGGRASLPAMAGNVATNLHELGVDVVPFQPSAMNGNTTMPVKNRLMTEAGQQLARWDEADTCPAYSRGDLASLRHADAVVVADYGKGAITPEVVEVLQGLTVPMFIDTKQNPAPWIGCKDAVLFPNLTEYRAHAEQFGWIEKVVLKMGAEGIAYLEYGKAVLTRPAYAYAVNCVNGAGDTVLAAFVAAVHHGLPLPQCLEFASSAAANVVEQHFLERTTDVTSTIGRLVELEEAEAESQEGVVKSVTTGGFAGWSTVGGEDGEFTPGETSEDTEVATSASTATSEHPKLVPGLPSVDSKDDTDYFRFFRMIGND